MNPQDVVLRFVEAINRADPDLLASLMTEDHTFVDSDGSELTGRGVVRDAWSRYFSLVSEYTVKIEQSFRSADTVVLVGTAAGAFAARAAAAGAGRWSVPAAWRALVAGDRVSMWQVFVNPQPMLAAMAADRGDSDPRR